MHPVQIGLMVVIFFVLLFLVLREFWCWYWKVNSVLAELKKLNKNIESLALKGPRGQKERSAAVAPDGRSTANRSPARSRLQCPACSASLYEDEWMRVDDKTVRCPACSESFEIDGADSDRKAAVMGAFQ